MKKIIFLILINLFIVPNVLAKEMFTGKDLVENMYIKIDKSYYDYHISAPHILKGSSDKVVYCIDPFADLDIWDYYDEYDYNDSIFNLSNVQLDRINVISYYGYNYINHNSSKWYGITQFEIWKTIYPSDTNFVDLSYNKTNLYDQEMLELEELVDNHYKLPSFSNNSYEYSINSYYEIEDLNNVLDNYEILNSDIDAKIVNNKLIVNTSLAGDYSIEFIKRSKVNHQYHLYYLEGWQSLIYPGKYNDIKFSININVSSGNIKIEKIDSENMSRRDAKLSKATYGLYDNDELITTIETNEDGVGYIDNIKHGNYYIKEIIPSEGYNLDSNVYEVNIDSNNKDIKIISKEEVIKGDVELIKVDSENKKRDKATLENAIYGLYQEDNLIKEINTDINGYAYISNLEYGKYYIKEITPSIGYQLDTNKYEIDIKDNSLVTIKSIEEIIKEDNNIEETKKTEEEIKDNNIIDVKPTEKIIEEDSSKEELMQKDEIETKEIEKELYKVQVVPVPNTFKIDKSYIIGFYFIILGILIVLLGKIKSII